MAALLDTGFLLAVIDADDNLHAACVAALESETNPILPDVVLPELAYLILRELGYPTLTKLLRAVAAGEMDQAQSTHQDLARAADLLEKYADNKVDFVDCVIVAMAERLNLTRVLTVDRRHFTVFRPNHCAYFEIAPTP
ncbi:MAG TPA: VapC toxin family PIN domain ribonuclease [Blastocatellia bacterium]|nr:VapC toxin family PIN domain ribonuclease [Blastocatellia bacterium]